MFGSLVLILPTVYEGGALVLRDRGEEWEIDHSDYDTPSIRYVAFYGDVEHEVLEVISGYRVTITKNLYFATPTFRNSWYNKVDSVLDTAFKTLLNDPTFLPEGGYIGFGLIRTYPVNEGTDLDSLLEDMKGGDESIVDVCRRSSLNVYARLLIEDEYQQYGSILLPFVPSIDYVEDHPMQEILNDYPKSAIALKEDNSDYGCEYWRLNQKPKRMKVFWVTEKTRYTQSEGIYPAYGNEPSVGYLYGHVCLIVGVGPVGSRSSDPKPPEPDSDWDWD